MPIELEGEISRAPHGTPTRVVAKHLAGLASQHFRVWRTVQPGLGGASCCAAVAVQPVQNLTPPSVSPFGLALMTFSVAYGNSQMAAGGLVRSLAAFPGHAERAALAAAAATAPLWTVPNMAGGNHYVLYVELAPCPPCQRWMRGDVEGPRIHMAHFSLVRTTLSMCGMDGPTRRLA
jgi:hypothetical protein